LDAQDVREEALRYMAGTGDARYAAALIKVAGDQEAMMEQLAVEAAHTLVALGEPAQLLEFLNQLPNSPPAKDRPPLCEIVQRVTGLAYVPLPDQTYRRYFVESLGPVSYPSSPRPPGIVRATTAGE
jgi:hypothetical protein